MSGMRKAAGREWPVRPHLEIFAQEKFTHPKHF